MFSCSLKQNRVISWSIRIIVEWLRARLLVFNTCEFSYSFIQNYVFLGFILPKLLYSTAISLLFVYYSVQHDNDMISRTHVSDLTSQPATLTTILLVFAFQLAFTNTPV